MPVPATTAPKDGDSLPVSLMKINALLYKSGGGGGGGGITTETDPLSVHTTGGTMTGALDFTGSQFSDPAPAIVIDNGSGNKAMLVYDSTADGAFDFKRNVGGTVYPGIIRLEGPCVITLNGNSGVQITQNGVLVLDAAANGGRISFTYGAINTALEIDSTTGDLKVVAVGGPNAGKSVNLTAGHWA